jgi:hypothetical protein
VQNVNAVAEGKVFYEKASNWLWSKKYMHTASCEELQRMASNKSVIIPTPDQVGDLLYRNKLNGLRWSDILQKLRFTKDQVDVQMITQACLDIPMAGRVYLWWGNDQQGPYSAYADPAGQFENVKRDKKVGPGLDTFVAIPLQ